MYGKHIEQILEKAEARMNAIRHMGFQRDGLRPESTIRMYNFLIRPILGYAAQVINYKHYFLTERDCEKIEEPTDTILKFENFQNLVLKWLIEHPVRYNQDTDRNNANVRKDRYAKVGIFLEATTCKEQ